MPRKNKKIPEEFNTLEEAAEFWDTHDSIDYEDVLEDVEASRISQEERHSNQ